MREQKRKETRARAFAASRQAGRQRARLIHNIIKESRTADAMTQQLRKCGIALSVNAPQPMGSRKDRKTADAIRRFKAGETSDTVLYRLKVAGVSIEQLQKQVVKEKGRRVAK